MNTHAALLELVGSIRSAVRTQTDWTRTADLVADSIRGRLPRAADLLTTAQRIRAGSEPGDTGSHVLHVERDGSFSIVAIVWRPGQLTRIHDHLTWCVFGVLEGIEHEERYELDEHNQVLVSAGATTNYVGDVAGFAPPGDIHRVHNTGADVAVSLHVYGTDLSRVGSSVRRFYDLPVRIPEGVGR
jgi:predicted metal-dependent enzyme (double-stranded beta helix superfamily)